MTCLNPAQCKRIADDLDTWIARHVPGAHREARDFWAEHGTAITELATDEAKAIARFLSKGDTHNAYRYLVLNSSLDTWRREREKTTEAFDEVAVRRERFREAMFDLGRRAARILGEVVGGVLRRAVGL